MNHIEGKILVVEDEFLIAVELVDALEERGAVVVGPVSGVAEAVAEIDRTPDLRAVVLDLNLRGELSVSVAEMLQAREIPFVLTSGYSTAEIPEGLRHVPLLGKPVDPDELVKALSA